MRTASAREGRVRLSDGRTLEYQTRGPRNGLPVLYFHGLAGSPVAASDVSEDLLDRAGVRWVAVQRPGFGASDALAGRRIVDWPDDVLALIDALDLGVVRIVGVSAGAPYALAAAAVLRERVAAVGAVSGLCPPGPGAPRDLRCRLTDTLVRTASRQLCGAADAIIAGCRRHPLPARMVVTGAVAGRAGCSREAVLAAFLASTKRGTQPVADELRLVLAPWGIEMGAVRCPVVLFHGARDRVVPVRHAEGLAASLPHSTIRICSGEGHFFFRRRMTEIFEAVLAAGRPPVPAPGRPHELLPEVASWGQEAVSPALPR